jgi:hypothetical protein
MLDIVRPPHIPTFPRRIGCRTRLLWPGSTWGKCVRDWSIKDNGSKSGRTTILTDPIAPSAAGSSEYHSTTISSGTSHQFLICNIRWIFVRASMNKITASTSVPVPTPETLRVLEVSPQGSCKHYSALFPWSPGSAIRSGLRFEAQPHTRVKT